MTATDNPASLTCWREIGVAGDGSCRRLAELGHCRNCPDYARSGRSLFERAIPAGFREEWSQVLAGVKETEPPGAFSVVVFRLQDEFLALRTAVFMKALEVRPVHGVPFRTNRIFRGIVNVDGVLLPCMSAAEVLGIAAPEERAAEAGQVCYRRMMVVKREGATCVFAVDEVLGVQRVAPAQLQKPPLTIGKSAKAMTVHVFPLEERTVGLLDEAKLLETFQRSLTP